MKFRTLASIRLCIEGWHIWRDVRWDGRRVYRYCTECELVEWYQHEPRTRKREPNLRMVS
jgi:hypothetical protein